MKSNYDNKQLWSKPVDHPDRVKFWDLKFQSGIPLKRLTRNAHNNQSGVVPDLPGPVKNLLDNLSPDIAKDPFGVSPTPSRRQFFDRMQGNPGKRSEIASQIAEEISNDVPREASAINSLYKQVEAYEKAMPPGAVERLRLNRIRPGGPWAPLESPGTVSKFMDVLRSRLRK